MPDGGFKLTDDKLLREQCLIDGEWVGADSNETIESPTQPPAKNWA